jgi:uncharacterized protein YidB (DUF937 family)
MGLLAGLLQHALFGMLEQGGTDGLAGLAKNFQSQGLGDIFSSWVSTGENKPIQPDQLQNALGPEKLQQLTGGTGMALQAALPLLAQILPAVIDKLTPQGQLPQNNNLLQQGLAALLGGPKTP